MIGLPSERGRAGDGELRILVAGSAALYDVIRQAATLPDSGQVAQILGRPGGEETFGGTAFNVAVGLARLGVRVALAHPVGEDFHGSAYQAWLRRVGVEDRGLPVVRGVASPRCYLFVCGEDVVGFSEAFPETEVPRPSPGWFAGVCQVVLAPRWTGWVGEAAAEAQRRGLRISAVGMGEELVGLLGGLDTLVLNEREARRMMDRLGIKAWSQLSHVGPRRVYVTFGVRGSLVIRAGSKPLLVPAARRRGPLVDPCGAGDGYAAGVLAALCRGLSARVAAEIGARVAAYVVTSPGCQSNLPTWEQVETPEGR